jgi:hypothetical protein
VSDSSAVTFRGASNSLQDSFSWLVWGSMATHSFTWGTGNRFYTGSPDGVNVVIQPGDVDHFFYWGFRGACANLAGRIFRSRQYARYDLPGLLAHEIAHFQGGQRLPNAQHAFVFGVENNYRRRTGRVLRCY